MPSITHQKVSRVPSSVCPLPPAAQVTAISVKAAAISVKAIKITVSVASRLPVRTGG